ncbi:MAG: hypothetical protein LBD29_04785 [Treponema sp.]|jgi:hypothetical protein|nr:hypothetical protein [Treponema sp.]
MDKLVTKNHEEAEHTIKVFGIKKVKKYLKVNILFTLLLGLFSGLIFLFYPRIDDTPVLSLYMLFSCIVLLYLGIHNINSINKYIKPIIILPLLFSGFMIYGILNYFVNGVFHEPPGIILFGIIMSISLFLIGLINLIKMLRMNVFKNLSSTF